MSTVLQVWFKPHAVPSLREPFALVELPFPDALLALHAIKGDELVVGNRLLTHRGEARGERVVHDSVVIGFRGSAVDRAELPTWRLLREAEES